LQSPTRCVLPRRAVAICTLTSALFGLPARALSPIDRALQLERISRESLCVTNGTVSPLPDGRLAIDSASSRAVVRKATAQTAEIRFRYVGPTSASKPLASGQLRRQIGIKLRAQDTCNLLYAMWHIEPDSRIAVSIKRNVGQRTHAECGAHGYRNIKPWLEKKLTPITPGEQHQFRAALRGAALTLMADGDVVWEGDVGDQVLQFDGPVGFRTDNARFEFDFLADAPDPGLIARTPAHAFERCERGPGD
jgi:hypothetical protein